MMVIRINLTLAPFSRRLQHVPANIKDATGPMIWNRIYTVVCDNIEIIHAAVNMEYDKSEFLSGLRQR